MATNLIRSRPYINVVSDLKYERLQRLGEAVALPVFEVAIH
jgi:hypothetical protein